MHSPRTATRNDFVIFSRSRSCGLYHATKIRQIASSDALYQHVTKIRNTLKIEHLNKYVIDTCGPDVRTRTARMRCS